MGDHARWLPGILRAGCFFPSCGLLLTWGSSSAFAPLSAPGRPNFPSLLVALVAGLAWLLLGWLLLGTFAALASLAVQAAPPGTVVHYLSRLVLRLAPRAGRRAAGLILGLALVPTGSVSAAAANHPLPGTGTVTISGPPALDRPAARQDHRAVPRHVVVHSGDSLWTLSARHLGAEASSAAVAREWPRWYATNRTTIGADPNLIRPGQVLRVPNNPPHDHAPQEIP